MEFNLVVCGLATFAAGVGYACTRRLSVNSSDWRSEKAIGIDEKLGTTISSPHIGPAISSTSQKRRSSLKRKNTEDHYRDTSTQLGYPHNLNHIYPRANKRCKTPTTEAPDGQEIARFAEPLAQLHINEDDSAMSNEPCAPQTSQPVATQADIVPVSDSSEKPTDATPTEVSTSQGNNEPADPSPASPHVEQPQTAAAPCPDDFVLVEVLKTSTPATPPAPKAFRGFAAFAGKTNAFAVATPSPSPVKSIWATTEEEGSFQDISNDNTVAVFSSLDEAGKNETTAKAGNVNTLTGEENEDVKVELKNLKLYIKRGKGEFSSEGMFGTLKLLADKTSGEERLLFRRDPLWQVSMNKRIGPAIRCVFSAGEKILRVITSETLDGALSEREVVIYAIKPGRGASKEQFEAFATRLIENEKLTS